MTLAKSLTAPRGEGYFSAANMVLAISATNSAIARTSIILTLLLKELFFTKYHYMKDMILPEKCHHKPTPIATVEHMHHSEFSKIQNSFFCTE
jgi:hypothetical protein